jgi:ElaB/YqjD/DUF883 family membrane-anchored ribosome-binding protein
MPQTPGAGTAASRPHPVHLTAIALRSAGQLYDLNVSAARVWMQTQARAAAVFGLPDWSPLFDAADERTRNVFSTGADQLLSTAQRANDVAFELQRQVGRVLETQTAQAAETWQRGLEELGSQATESLTQLADAARQSAEEAEREVQAAGQGLRESLRETGGNGAERPRPSPSEAEQRRGKPSANA